MTPSAVDYWTTRHEGRPDWARTYWDSAQAPHRDAMLKAVEAAGWPDSILEIGCNAGPNVRRLMTHPRAPALMVGIDLNPEAIKEAQTRSARAPWRDAVLWVTGDWRRVVADATPPSYRLGAVLSCYTLAYLTPRELVAGLMGLRGVAPLLIALEPMTRGPSELCGDGPEWRHPYLRAARWVDPAVEFVAHGRIDPPADRLDGWLVLRWSPDERA